MKLHLYNQTRTDAFLICKKTLIQMGYIIGNTDETRGMITATKSSRMPLSQKENNQYSANGIPSGDILYFNVLLASKRKEVRLTLISHVFSAREATFVANHDSESAFMKIFYEHFTKKPLEMLLH